ncbi:MAG: FimV/HubP family polar landmark protein [Gammaproteobacteria bacterium]|nr:FimV/HubP family polar landmark protein [Gammaproteobacteria bacterium]MDX2488081.1 FimV/HubP family polar landmark protein [Gammaproteobacteria bacterium]
MQKVKGIKLACLAAFAILPIQAYALGVGKLTMHSALDEPLNASIELTAVTATELQSLEVKLGSAGVFNMAGIDRNEQLKSISFSLVKENGKDLIRLKTEQPFRDPFLHFIINASWANGSMLREYTALLDPPSYLSGAPARIQAPAVATPVAVQPAPVPVAVAKTEQAPAPSAVAVAAPITPADTVERKLGPTDIGASGTSYSSDMGPGSTYGPVKSGEVLWSIAEQVRAGTQMETTQVVMAIFKQNPNAFMQNNINLIRVGQTLQIPSESEITSTSPSVAREELRVQMAEWQEYNDNLSSGSRVAETESTVADKEMPGADDKETVDETTAETTADKDDSTPSADAMESGADEQDVLEIVRAKVDATDSSGSGASAEELAEYESAITAYKENVGMLEESLASADLEKQDLSERVALLEQQIDKANKLIDMQNADLARIQAQGQEGDVEPVELIEVAETAEIAEITEVSPAEPDASPISPDASPIALDATPAMAEKSIYESTLVSPEDVAPVTPVTQVKPPAPEVKEPPVVETPPVVEKKAAKTRVRPAPAAEEKGFVASIMDFVTSSWMTMLGSALALLLVLVGLFVVLRRRRSIAEFEDSIISGTAVLDISTAESTEPTDSGSETSFLSDFVPGMGNMQADEVDPLAEAEVYMAYGRDEQAEEVLKEAASKTPDRHELKLKLLEIYQSRKDVSSFETLAEELYPADGNIPMAVWAKVAEMGKIVNPENPLFQGDIKIQEDTLFGDKERKEDVTLGDLLDTDTIDAEEAELMEALDEDISEDDSEEFNEQIIEGIPEEITEEIKAESEDLATKVDDFPVPDEEVLNMDLGDFTPDVAQETDSFDLDTLNVTPEDLGSELDAITEETEAIEEGEIDFNLDGIDLDLGESSDTEETALDMSGLEGLDLDLELDEDSSIDALNIDSENDTSEMSLQDETLEFADLGDLTLTDVDNDSVLDIESGEDDSGELPAGANETWDEAGTKLDLARAYIEMDDKESAQSILEEVVKEGTDDQKSEARDLINQIDAG